MYYNKTYIHIKQHLEAINPVPNLRRQHSYWRAHVGDILQL